MLPRLFLVILLLLSFGGVQTASADDTITLVVIKKGDKIRVKNEKISKSDAEWKKSLPPEAFHILREKGTEQAFTGKYWDLHEKGVYLCAACGNELFSSETKFDSGTGWPSFWQPLADSNVRTEDDRSLSTHRTEVVCSLCGGHLGHVFDDGPKPTGLRYCINSAALKFNKKDNKGK